MFLSCCFLHLCHPKVLWSRSLVYFSYISLLLHLFLNICSHIFILSFLFALCYLPFSFRRLSSSLLPHLSSRVADVAIWLPPSPPSGWEDRQEVRYLQRQKQTFGTEDFFFFSTSLTLFSCACGTSMCGGVGTQSVASKHNWNKYTPLTAAHTLLSVSHTVGDHTRGAYWEAINSDSCWSVSTGFTVSLPALQCLIIRDWR